MTNPTSTAVSIGEGFAFFAQQRLDPRWVINLPHYGAFLFAGTESEAEEMRAHKARWEGEVAHKRSASYRDLDAPSPCWNHKGYVRVWLFGSRGRPLKNPRVPQYFCECGECSNVVS